MPTRRLWVNDNGAIACDQHGGMYLASAIAARPRAKTHRTPLGTWEIADLADLTASFREAGLPAPDCEICTAATPARADR